MCDTEKDGDFMPATMDANTIYIGSRKYVASDLIPQWRPIGAWSKAIGQEWCDFIRRKPNSIEWIRCDRQRATHFMHLTPPERHP